MLVAVSRVAWQAANAACLHQLSRRSFSAQPLRSSLDWSPVEDEQLEELPQTCGLQDKSFAPGTWARLRHLAARRGSAYPSVVDLGLCCEGVSALGAMGDLKVTAVHDDARMLECARQRVRSEKVAVRLLTTTEAEQQLPRHAADLVLVASMQPGDMCSRLARAHSLLANDGLLVVAWNDRDMSKPLARPLERFVGGAVLGRENHEYVTTRLALESVTDEAGRPLFCVVSFSVLANPLRMRMPVAPGASATVMPPSPAAAPAPASLHAPPRSPAALHSALQDGMARYRTGGMHGSDLATACTTTATTTYHSLLGSASCSTMSRASTAGTTAATATTVCDSDVPDFVLPLETKLFVLRRAC